MSEYRIVTDAHERTDKWFKTLSVIPDYIEAIDNKRTAFQSRSNTIRVLECKSLKDWNDFMQSHRPEGTYYESGKQSYNLWNGTKTWDEYLELLENGDEKVMKKIKLSTAKELHNLEKKYEEVITGYKFDVSGEFFDIGLVLSGVPETWLHPQIEEQEKQRITMRINMGFRSGTDSDTVINNGAKLLGMAKLLENLHVEVAIELYNFADNWGRSETIVHSLTAKGFNEPINYRKLSSLLTTAYQRRGSFRLREVLSGGSSVGGSQFPNGFTAISRTSDVERLEKQIFGGMKNDK